MTTPERLGSLPIRAIVMTACGGPPGARPHDMSEGAHEETAGEHAQHTDALHAGSVRWTSDASSTEEDRAEAERHRQTAAITAPPSRFRVRPGRASGSTTGIAP